MKTKHIKAGLASAVLGLMSPLVIIYSTSAAPVPADFVWSNIMGDLGTSRGATMGDVNNDGYLDIYVANSGQQNKLWLNDGTGNFTANDITGDLGNSYDTTMGDVNNDGYLDIYVANSSQQNKLWLNDGSGNFTADDIVGDLGTSRGATMGDVNNDGYLDIYVANSGQQNKLWLNDGSGNFTANDIVGDFGGVGATMGDVNNDGFLDIYVLDDWLANKLWLNDGSGNFTANDIAGDIGGYGATMGDVNNDGFLDIYAGFWGGQNKLWLNDGTGNFTANDIAGDNFGDGATMGDVNNDGFLDIYVVTEEQGNKLWLNDGSGNFTSSNIAGDSAWSLGAIMGDFNNDGFLDIYVANGNPVQNKLWLQTPRDDGDGSPDEAENLAPNRDGNGDGVVDFVQRYVTTQANSFTDAYTTLALDNVACRSITAFNVVAESSLATEDTGYDYPAGLNDFTIDCETPGASTTITIYYDKVYDTSEWVYRKFINNEYIDITSLVTFSTATINGSPVTTATYTVTDGDPQTDADGTANGTIVDPAGPAILADATTTPADDPAPGVPDTGIGSVLTSPPAALAATFATISVVGGLKFAEQRRKSVNKL
jgi:hypothetical protein